MDLHRVIRSLRQKRDKLDLVIASLEQLEKAVSTGLSGQPKKRRGRKFMDEKSRKEVSERMKRYWADRRKQQQDKA